MDFFHFKLLNMDLSVTIYIINLKFSVCILKVLLKRKLSQYLYIGPSFTFYDKIRVTCFFQYKFLHLLKYKLEPKSTF